MTLDRRRLFGCALCAGLGLIATDAGAQASAMPGVTRKLLSQSDGPVAGTVVVQMEVTVEPTGLIMRHTHPGIESGYMVEGAATLLVDDVGERAIRPGDGWMIPRERPHSVRMEGVRLKLLSTYVVDKDKPLVSPA